MLITVINYLDRGTLNYMWVANIEYNLENEIDNNLKINQAVKEGDTYKLVKSNGEEITTKVFPFFSLIEMLAALAVISDRKSVV